jgi:hypothetical protein
MLMRTISSCTLRPASLVIAFIVFTVGAGPIANQAAAQTEGQRTFSTPAEGVKALMTALESNDTKALLAVLGTDAKEIVYSGDPVNDKAEKDWFVDAYKQRHSLVASGADKRILTVGPNDWPLAIPLVYSEGKWHFDSAAGKDEMLYRRIGSNELGAIAAARGVVAAQRDYHAQGHDSQPAGQYAQRLKSEPGKHDGLYWETTPGEPASPAGPLLAQASSGGYSLNTAGKLAPYHGYYYRLLTAQGTAAPGGAKNYLIDGKLTGGFALVAYPAEYRNSGVMTFIVDKDGVIYQKDLGEKTAELAKGIDSFNPDSTWTKVASSVSVAKKK